jgi:AcrR family transcriptional regulator
MREPLLVALRKEAARLHPRLPTEEDVATAAGVAVADVRTHLGPPDNYSALLSYQGQTLDTRARIIASAARVFGQKGFQRASLDQVASDAGLTKGAIYWHFKSKNDLYFALLDSRFLRDISAMRESVDAMMVTATHETAPDLMARIFQCGAAAIHQRPRLAAPVC